MRTGAKSSGSAGSRAHRTKKRGKAALLSTAPPRVALLVETSTAFGRRVLCGIAAYIKENAPWSVYFGERAVTDGVPQWLRGWRGDGIISRIGSPEVAEVVSSLNLPVVDLNEQFTTPDVPRISNDHAMVGRMAAHHLLDRGFNSFGFIGHRGLYFSDRRRQEFIETVRAAGGSAVEYLGKKETPQSYQAATWELEMDAVAEWAKELRKPAGVMTCGDLRGLQLLQACHRVDIAVPEQIAIIGVGDDNITCELATPPLSSVVLNAWRMGYEAAAMLDRLLRGERPPKYEILIPPLDVACRQSTEITAVTDPLVAKAMRFIRENACKGINVEDVLAHLIVSRTCLQDRFRKNLHRSIHDFIIDARISRVKELLAQTSLSRQDIAERTGFRYAEYMSLALKQRAGWTPTAYRQEHGAKSISSPI